MNHISSMIRVMQTIKSLFPNHDVCFYASSDDLHIRITARFGGQKSYHQAYSLYMLECATCPEATLLMPLYEVSRFLQPNRQLPSFESLVECLTKEK